MNRKYSWLIALVLATLLVAACGPQMATPTSSDEVAATDTVATAPTEAPPSTEPASPTATQEEAPTTASESSPTEPPAPPATEGDGRVLGSPDAPVTIVEYSDFQ